MTGSGGSSTPLKAIQDGAMEIYRNIMPAFRRCSSFRHHGTTWMAGIAERRASHQQAENLKWQQDMFLRLINMAGLCQEGLLSESDVASFRQKILDNIVVCYDGGEYPQVTRDKLLFLQELLYARCISEEEYHTAKKSLLYRLAAQGAVINSSDIVLTCSAAPLSAPTTPIGRKKDAETPEVCSREPCTEGNKNKEKSKTSKSPVKHILEAVSRLKHNSKVHNEAARPRVPHAMDFIRPKDCPARDPPEFDISDQCGSPLFYSPSGSVSSMESSSKPLREPPSCTSRYKEEAFPATRTVFPTSSPPPKSPLSGPKAPCPPQKSPSGKSPLKPVDKVGSLITDMMWKLHGEEEGDQVEDVKLEPNSKQREPLSTTPKQSSGTPKQSSASKKPWRLDMLRPPRIVTPRQDNAATASKTEKTDSSDPAILSPNKVPKANSDTVKLKKKIHSKGASTDFYIDKVLGENIKKELEHIRSEINRTNSTQTFTNDQIDAIATRLPADKSELMRFFPKSWCDRYGDIVLDVVHKEFKGHVKDMETARKHTKEKRSSSRQGENDENSGSTNTTNINYEGATICKASSKTGAATGKNKSESTTRCFTATTTSGSSTTPRKVTSFNTNVELYEKELDGKLCAEIEKLSHRRTPLRV